RDPAPAHPGRRDGGPVPAVAARPALRGHRGRPRLGRAPGERDQRPGPAARRALAGLDPPGGALPRAHQGGESRRLLPPGRLGGRPRARHPARGRSVSAADLLSFLRRELAPTPGRGSATFRLTLACLVATIPVLTHRIPHALIIMIMMYL